MKALLALIPLIVLTTIPSPIQAQNKLQKELRKGVKCFDQLNYGCAIRSLKKAAALASRKPESLKKDAALLLCKTRAFALAAVNRHEEAVASFEQCFATDPVFYLDPQIISPKIYADFRTARRKILFSKLKGQNRPPTLPPVFGPPPTERLFLHRPAEFSQRQWTLIDNKKRIHILLGAHFLFGDDANSFEPGFGIQLAYGWTLSRFFEASAGVRFFQHKYAGNNLKSGASGTLLVVQPTIGLRAHLRLAQIWDIGLGLHMGAGIMGVGNLSDRVGGLAALSAFVSVTPHPNLALGINVAPTLVMARLDNDQLGNSMSLPVFASIQLRF